MNDFINKYTDIFYEEMREAFALQKLYTFFNKKYWLISVVVVVAMLFYVHGKHLRSCRDGQLT